MTNGLYENRIFPFDINTLRNHVFVGGTACRAPYPGDPVSTNFHRSLCPRRAWGFIWK